MYPSLPYVCDAIADFVRRLAPADSSPFTRLAVTCLVPLLLRKIIIVARAGMSNISAGDDTALFNSVLLTVRDAARVAGRKAIVLFSNGPDNASVLGPEDVGRVAENEGIPIYVISTQDAAQDRTLFDALQRADIANRRKTILRTKLAAASRSIHVSPRRYRQFLYGLLLSRAEREPRIPQH